MSTIDKLQNDLSNWYETSSVGQFMRWWKSELLSFVPEKYQQQLFPQAINIMLTQEQEEVVVWKNTVGDFVIEQIEEEEVMWWHKIQHIINDAEGRRVNVIYLLPNNQALVRKIALPQAAKENLDEVIGFELDKYVPFKTEQVQLSYKIDKDNSNEDKIVLDLAVVPKQKVAEIIALAEEKSVELDALDVNIGNTMQPRALGVNLLPPENRKERNYFNLKFNLALLFLLFVLIYFVMYTSVINKQEKVEQLTNINTELSKQAKKAKQLRKELKSVIVSSKFLNNKKNNNPSLVTILSDITNRLPEDTYITRLKVNKEKLELTGQSNSASNLVPELNKSSSWFQPEIVGGVTIDRRTKKEKFTIKALLKEPKIEGEDDSTS
jgi:general secretion pathway protein L